MTATKQYDNLNRLRSISSSAGGTPIAAANYVHNEDGQRVRCLAEDGSYWLWEYDSWGQVRSGRKFWSDGTPVVGQQFEYQHDSFGNRTSTAAGGDAEGENLWNSVYSANHLNQYINRTVPGVARVLGLAPANKTVTVNGLVSYRRGGYFAKEIPVQNTTSAVWAGLTNAIPNEPPLSGNMFVPQTPETFSYDLDGNLLSDGRWFYTWDAENRLVKMVARNTSPAVGPQQWLEFAYDWQGRRISKKVGAIGSTTATNELRFVYDGWNLIGELNSSGSQVRSYVWGTDLSGSMQGAGGVGGLLWINDAATINNQPSTHFVSYDGNGNMTALVNAADGAESARYDYGPLGELLRATGPMARANPFRFSTKYQDDETDLLYYGYRYYNASTGKWLSGDPIEEQGGRNLYGFVGNDPIDNYDVLGLFETGSQGRTDAVKNSSTVRADVATLVHNMLASRDKSCTKGKAIERKRFNPASTTSYAFMYFTGYFLLGQVSVPLDGKGYYEVDCCKKKFGKWEIVVHGSFRDKFDELIPVPGPKKGVGSLPLTFVGEWVEFYSGSE